MRCLRTVRADADHGLAAHQGLPRLSRSVFRDQQSLLEQHELPPLTLLLVGETTQLLVERRSAPGAPATSHEETRTQPGHGPLHGA